MEVDSAGSTQTTSFTEVKETVGADWRTSMKGQVSFFESYFEKYKILVFLSNKTGLPKVQCAGALAFSLFLVVVFGFGPDTLSDLVGFCYPFSETIKVLRHDSENFFEIKFWLHYWLVFGVFVVFETFLDDFLSWWLPMYFFIKIGFLCFCFLPYTRGAELVYNQVIDPAWRKFQELTENLKQE
eukprot:GILI01051532.1.p2 GENE.GILI01051532.1~~GILI01051532.1.p2  ORF type:complete len:202 (+),score=22.64 GILI01051532.1:55-606(+)